MLALEPCRVHICSKDIITELDNGFQQNTRHTGRPSRHPRSIPMRRMSSNWAHRHRSPASHAPTGGASVADVLPKGRLPRGDTSAHLRTPHPVCRASVADVLPKGRLPREAPPLTAPSLPCPRGGCFAGREGYHEEAPPLTAPSMRCLRGGCFAEREDYHGEVPPEASPSERHLDRDFPVGKVPRGATPAAEGTRFIVKGQRTAT